MATKTVSPPHPPIMPVCPIPIPVDSDFTLSNIPFGIFSTAALSPRVGTRVGDTILSLSHIHASFPLHATLPTSTTLFTSPTLNALASLPHPVRAAVRTRLQSLLLDPAAAATLTTASVPAEEATMHLPLHIGDYTDFYAGLHHARTVGTIFRGAAEALQQNYLHLPVGYHGRASSVVVSGTPVRRPRGQIAPVPNSTPPAAPTHEPTKKLDFELELGAIIGGAANELGKPVSAREARGRIFGYVLVNDWSARDVQAWEYVPLGPFTSKSFATTISAWVVTPEALDSFRVSALPRPTDLPSILPYLRTEDGIGEVLDVALHVDINRHRVTHTSGRNLVWSFEQMIAHHTVGGCNLLPGDLLASGTISGPASGEQGCLLEATWNGRDPVKFAENSPESRTWLLDGDEVVIRGCAGDGENRVGWGECKGVVLPAWEV